ncbi:MAG: NADP-dependent phosphogluconate dehydrogenase [Pseudomonadota bacterium]
MTDADIGLIGLGVMGANLALNIADKGHTVAVYNRTAAKTDSFMQQAGPLAERFVPCRSLSDLVTAIRPPRPIIMMVKAGEAVDEQIDALRPLVAADDILIDAGNANFHDTRRRVDALGTAGPRFLGIGVSGGAEGARNGPSIMVGGTRDSYARVEPILSAIAARYEDDPCSAYLGSDGAGHFVKTIHNGIEYANMQMIAEIFGLLRNGYGRSPKDIGHIFDRWNSGMLKSYLIEITGRVLAADDPDTGQPVVDIILDRAGQKGTGRWTAIEAQALGVPATTIEAAVSARALSALKQERVAAAGIYEAPQGVGLGDYGVETAKTLEKALHAATIIAYAQGFAALSAASDENGWNLPYRDTARIWRAGCIIRSAFLDVIMRAYEDATTPSNLLVAPAVVETLTEAVPALRTVVAGAVAAGMPVPALGAALGYFETYRNARTTAYLLQAQRDYFGEHGFERIDRPGDFHGPWGPG